MALLDSPATDKFSFLWLIFWLQRSFAGPSCRRDSLWIRVYFPFLGGAEIDDATFQNSFPPIQLIPSSE